MEVEVLELTDFRNYAELQVSFRPGLNLIIGLNGQGKTNLVEALHALSVMGSHRTSVNSALVRQGEERAIVRADVSSRRRKVHLDLEVKRAGGMRMLVNKVPLDRARDAEAVIATILFSPEDLSLTKGGPEERRRFLDHAASRLRPVAGQERLEFERALKQRNGVLKASQSNERALRTLSSWDEQVVRTGAAVVTHRLRVLEGLRPLFEKGYAEVAGSDEHPGAVYRASWCTEVPAEEEEIADVILAWLEASRSKDIERGITTAGPHRDDLEITLSGSEARTFGSQGEQRSLALALRLAERDLVSEARGEDPVLLLDDVFSELDDERRERLAELVMGGGQTIATATSPEGLPISPEQTMRVQAGRLVESA